HRVERRLALVARGAHDAFEQALRLLRRVTGGLVGQRRVGGHCRAIRPHTADAASFVRVIPIAAAIDDALAITSPVAVPLLKVHLQTRLGERLAQARVVTVPDHPLALLVDQDGLVRDAGTTATLAPVA